MSTFQEEAVHNLIADLEELDAAADLNLVAGQMNDDKKGVVRPFRTPRRYSTNPTAPKLARIIHEHTPKHGLLAVFPSSGRDPKDPITNLTIGQYDYWGLTIPFSRINNHATQTSLFLSIKYEPRLPQDDSRRLPQLVYPIGHLLCRANEDAGDDCRWGATPSWFTVVMDIEKANRPIWLVFDPIAADWDSSEGCNKFTAVEDDQQQCWIDEGHLLDYGPSGAGAQKLFQSLVDGKYDLIKLFDKASDWSSRATERVDRFLNDMSRRYSVNPRLTYATREELQTVVKNLKSEEIEPVDTIKITDTKQNNPPQSSTSSPSTASTRGADTHPSESSPSNTESTARTSLSQERQDIYQHMDKVVADGNQKRDNGGDDDAET